MTWQPVETAPLNGTLVDLWISAEGAEFRATDFRWNGTMWQHKHGDILEQYFSNVGMRVTHWIHIPQPPR